MQYLRNLLRLMSAVFAILLTQSALASDWKVYEAKSYGYSMLVPVGVTVREQEWGGGWGGISASFEGVNLYGRAKLGARETDADIEAYAVRIIGIPASQWTMVDSGSNQRGWGRYKTFRATYGAKLYFGGYGTGPQGNYLLYLETTTADYNQNRADYDKWYESIRLQ